MNFCNYRAKQLLPVLLYQKHNSSLMRAERQIGFFLFRKVAWGRLRCSATLSEMKYVLRLRATTFVNLGHIWDFSAMWLRACASQWPSFFSVVEELFIKRRRPALIYWDAKWRRKETDLGDRRKKGGKEGESVFGWDGALTEGKTASDHCWAAICRAMNVLWVSAEFDGGLCDWREVW